MVHNGIPLYTPSGNGPMNDLKNVKISEILGWGGYKGKLTTQQEDVAGLFIHNENGENIECYNWIDIDGFPNDPTSETYKLLETLGIDEDGMLELADAWNNNNLETFQVRWDADLGTFQENFDQFLDKIVSDLYDTTRIVLTGVTRIRAGSRDLPIYTQDWGISSTSTCTVLNLDQTGLEDYDDENIADARRLTNIYTVSIFNNTIDVTANFDEDFRDMLTALILMEGDNSFVKISESFIIDDKNLIQTEEFSSTLNKSYISEQYKAYTVDDPNQEDEKYRIVNYLKDDGNGVTNLEYFSFYWAHFWNARDGYTLEDIYGATEKLFIEILNHKYMTKEGLKKSTKENFGYYVSEFMEIYNKVDGGNWLKRFVMGIIKAFLSLIDAFLNIIEMMPVLGQIMQIMMTWIGSIFGFSYEQIREFVKIVILMIILSYASALLGAYLATTGGAAATVGTNLLTGIAGGAMTVPQMLSFGLEIYSAGMAGLEAATRVGIEEEAEEASKREENIEADTPSFDAFLGTMGSRQQHEDSDTLMYVTMFNPLDSLILGEMPQIPNQQKTI